MNFNNNPWLREYRDVHLYTNTEQADPHGLILLLLDGALNRLSSARACVEEGRTAEKCELLSSVMNIVDGLRLSLDRQQGGAIADNLDTLYEYINRRMLVANSGNDLAAIDEARELLRQIREAWIGIANAAGKARAPVMLSAVR
jgi:flagellar protein FliS